MALERYETYLKAVFGDKFSEFKEALLKSEAIISGGSVLKYVLDDNSASSTANSSGFVTLQDIDIYVNTKNAYHIRNFINNRIKNTSSNYGIKLKSNRMEDSYCESFLSKNRIQRVVNFLSYRNYDESAARLNIDLMYVRDSQPLEEVVKNFDLSCCMNYYDGNQIKSFFLEETLRKEMILGKDYHGMLVSNNRFTATRIRKYMQRGFRLRVENLSIPKLTYTPKNKNVQDFLRMLIFSMTFKRLIDIKNTNIHHILSERYYYYNSNDIFENDYLDDENFVTIEDYTEAVYKKEAIKSCNLLKNFIKSNKWLPTNCSKHNKKSCLEYIDKFLGLIGNNDISKYAKLGDFKCIDEVNMENCSIVDYLKNDDNHIIVKFNDIYTGYDREEIFKYMCDNVSEPTSIPYTKFYDGKRIFHCDIYKIKHFLEIRLFTLDRTGVKNTDDEEIYNLIPYMDVDKFITS